MPKLRFGTIGWSYNFWKDKFYPKQTTPKEFLTYYSSQFDTVEVDSTFYRIPTKKTVNNWKQQTPTGFLFSVKFPQVVTHIKMLKDCGYETEVFLDRVKLLGEKLGPLLLQFPSNFSVERMADLENFLNKLPPGHRYVVEVRNKNWLKPDFYSLLRDCNVALAWADSHLIAQIDEVTASFLYVRWEGDRKKINGTLGLIEVDRMEDLKLVADQIKPLSTKMDVFGYFGKYYSGYPPSDIANLKWNLNSN